MRFKTSSIDSVLSGVIVPCVVRAEHLVGCSIGKVSQMSRGYPLGGITP